MHYLIATKSAVFIGAAEMIVPSAVDSFADRKTVFCQLADLKHCGKFPSKGLYSRDALIDPRCQPCYRKIVSQRKRLVERSDYRGYIRATNWHSARKQRESLLAAGVPLRAIYTDERGSIENRPAAIASMRSGDTLVVYRLFTLAMGRNDLPAVIEEIKARPGAVGVLCAQNGRFMPIGGVIEAAAEIQEANLEWAGEKYNPDRKIASAKGREGGRTKVLRKIPAHKAWDIWHGPGTEQERLERMPGWNKPAAHRYLGSKVSPKPRPKARNR